MTSSGNSEPIFDVRLCPCVWLGGGDDCELDRCFGMASRIMEPIKNSTSISRESECGKQQGENVSAPRNDRMMRRDSLPKTPSVKTHSRIRMRKTAAINHYATVHIQINDYSPMASHARCAVAASSICSLGILTLCWQCIHLTSLKVNANAERKTADAFHYRGVADRQTDRQTDRHTGELTHFIHSAITQRRQSIMNRFQIAQLLTSRCPVGAQLNLKLFFLREKKNKWGNTRKISIGRTPVMPLAAS